MLIVRPGTFDDIPAAVEYAKEVVKEGFFQNFTFAPDKMAAYLKIMMKNDQAFVRAIIDGQETVGGFCGQIFQPYFSDEYQASDDFFFIKKPYRGKAAPQLLQILHEFQAWATDREAKCVILGTSAGINVDKISDMLTSVGFPKIGYLNGRRL